MEGKMKFHPCPMLMAQVLIPCWIHFYLPSLTKWSSDIWIVDLFFRIIDDMVALDCILNSCCNLPVPFSVQVPCLKTNSASLNKEHPVKGEGGMIRENGIETCIISYKKQITSQVQCRIQDVWGWCTGMTQRDGTGREVGGGFRMGNTCTPMADAC